VRPGVQLRRALRREGSVMLRPGKLTTQYAHSGLLVEAQNPAIERILA